MKNTLNYKGFLGSVHLSEEDEMFYGKLEGISDCIMFEGACITTCPSTYSVNLLTKTCDCLPPCSVCSGSSATF